VGRDESGFTLVEVAVAILLLTVVFLGAEWAVISTMAAASLSREHTEAVSLITRTVSKAEALTFSSVWTGLNPSADSSLSTDRYVTQSGSTYTLSLLSSNNTIATCSTSTSNKPLVPHTNTLSDGITYTISAYPISSPTPSCAGGASAGNPPANASVTLVVVVSWKAPKGQSEKVVGQAVIAP
jgi:hypothetical protein